MWLSDKIEDMIDNAKMKAGSKNPMTKFSYHYGGNMCGNSHTETVMPVDEKHARISISHADWHYETPKVSEYLTDIGIMDELEHVFHKHSMERWHGKKFTNMFVCDGESYSYEFEFGKAYISFSSQIYPKKYSEKLDELHEVVKKHLENAEKLPYLLAEEVKEEDGYKHYKPDDGKIRIEASRYAEGMLYHYIFNGTDEKTEYDRSVKIYREGEEEPFFSEEDKYHRTIYQHSSHEEYSKIPEQLSVGKYRLEMGEYSCEFEIVKDPEA